MNCSIIEKKITDYTLAHRDKVGHRIDQSESSIAPRSLGRSCTGIHSTNQKRPIRDNRSPLVGSKKMSNRTICHLVVKSLKLILMPFETFSTIQNGMFDQL